MRRNDSSDSQAGGNPLAPYAPPVYTMPAGLYGSSATATSVLPSGSRGLPTALGLLNALKRRWVLASFLGLLAGMAAAAGVWIALPTGKHQVRAMMEIQPLQHVNPNTFDNNFESFKKNQETLIKLRPLLQKVAKHPDVAELAVIRNNDDPAKWIEDQIKYGWESDIMVVRMNGDNPEMLRVVLNRLVKDFVIDSSENQKADARAKKTRLMETKKSIKEEIERLETMIRRQNEMSGGTLTGGSEAIITRMTQQLSLYDQEKHNHETAITEAEAALKSIAVQMKNIDTMPIDSDILKLEMEKWPTGLAFQQEIEDEEQSLATERKRYTNAATADERLAPRKKRIEELKAKFADLKAKEQTAVETRIRLEKKARLAGQNELHEVKRDTSKAKLDSVSNMIESLQGKIERLARGTLVMKNDIDDLTPLKTYYSEISKQINDLDMLSKSPNRIIEREEAIVIMNHNLKQKMMFSGIVAVIAFVAVMVLVSYLEWRSRRVDGVEQVVNELGMRIIGTIPAFPTRASLKAGEADQNQNWRFVLNESVNSTRTMLLHTAKSQSMQVIMVTSAMQGEGKTSLASQLGTSMATAGLRTLILDCDLRNPSMHRLFDVQLTPGCSEILCQEADVSDAVQPTTVPNLWMIPAGQCSNRVIAALAQGHPLETLFNRLRGQFDFIVVDSCPVLPVADALLVGQHVDGVVISILQDISQLPKVMNASERLTQLNIPLLGAVVNGIKTDVHAYGYNYVKQLPA